MDMADLVISADSIGLQLHDWSNKWTYERDSLTRYFLYRHYWVAKV